MKQLVNKLPQERGVDQVTDPTVSAILVTLLEVVTCNEDFARYDIILLYKQHIYIMNNSLLVKYTQNIRCRSHQYTNILHLVVMIEE